MINTVVHVGSQFQLDQLEAISFSKDPNTTLYIVENLNSYADRLRSSGFSVVYIEASQLTFKTPGFSRQVAQIRETLQNLIHRNSQIHLIVASINNIAINILFQHFKIATIWKYEDGMLDYLPQLKKDSIFETIIKYIFFFKVIPYTSYVDRTKLIDVFYWINNDKGFSGIDGNRITLGMSVDVIGSHTLFLTQALSEDNVISLATEISIYRNALRNLSLTSVTLKPHPRSSEKKRLLLKKLAREFHVDFYEERQTAEQLLSSGHFSKIVGCYSNTLFYADRMFGIPGYSYLPMVETQQLEAIYERLSELDVDVTWLAS